MTVRLRTGTLAGILTFAGAVFAYGGFATTDSADASVCGTRDDIRDMLVQRYDESRRALGLVSDQGLVEVFTSDKGTWSILVTSAGGRTCLIAAGDNWQELDRSLNGPSA